MTIYRERRDGEKCRDGPFSGPSRLLGTVCSLYGPTKSYLPNYWAHKNGSPIKMFGIRFADQWGSNLTNKTIR